MDVRSPSTTRTGKPTVVLADDHRPLLRSVSRMLADDFEIVAAVGDGRQAIDAAGRLDPDVIVLDITMPNLNGFQTAEALKRSGSRAAVVFLTMHEEDECVAEAIRCGAKAYILKIRARSDLSRALRHALAGRQFLPSLSALATMGGTAHAVKFHSDDIAWLDDAAGLLSASLHRGDVVVTILAESNREAVHLGMKNRGCDIDGLAAQGRYLAFECESALTRIMVNGQPDANAIAEMTDGLDRARLDAAAGPHSRLTLVGEMAALLCRRGNLEAALQVERLWDDKTSGLPFLTVCAYPLDCFDPKVAHESSHRLCAQHSVISHSDGQRAQTLPC